MREWVREERESSFFPTLADQFSISPRSKEEMDSTITPRAVGPVCQSAGENTTNY